LILTPLQNLPGNVGDLGKIIVVTSFEWLPKVQKIAQSCYTECLWTLNQQHAGPQHKVLQPKKGSNQA